MSATTAATAHKTPEGALGALLSGLVGAVNKSNPSLLSTLLAETALSSAISADLAKAHESLEGEGFKQVTDQWDGSPADRLTVVRTTGGETMAIPVGPVQQAQGGGAQPMISQYSDLAVQYGAQKATEILGRQLGSTRAAVKSLLGIVEVQQTNIGALHQSISALTEQVATLSKAIVKSEGEEVKVEEAHREKETEEDKAASFIRPRAEKALAAASAAVVKSQAAKAAAKDEEGEEWQKKAEEETEKAKSLVLTMHDIAPNSTATAPLFKSLTDLTNSIAALKVSKSAAVAAPVVVAEAAKGNGPDIAALNEAAAQISKAAAGLGMLSTNLEGLFKTVSGQSRSDNGTLPPVFDIAKASSAHLDGVKTGISNLLSKGEISQNDADYAVDVLGRVTAAKAGVLPEHIAKSAVARAVPAVQALFAHAA